MDRPSTKFGAFVAVGFIGAAITYWMTKSPKFPYGKPDHVKIQFNSEVSNPGGRQIYDLTGENARGQAIVTSMGSKNEALRLVDAEIVGIRSTYEKMTAPYPGQITKAIECDTKKFVRELALPPGEVTGSVIVAAANDRRIFGVCAADEVKYVGGVWAAFDEARRNLILVKLYAPVGGPEEIEAVQKVLWRTFMQISGQDAEII